MSPEDYIRMMQQKGFRQQPQEDVIPLEKLDLFINRVVAEKDETLYTMAQAIQWKLHQSPMVSLEELRIYPKVLQRIQERMQKGET